MWTGKKNIHVQMRLLNDYLAARCIGVIPAESAKLRSLTAPSARMTARAIAVCEKKEAEEATPLMLVHVTRLPGWTVWTA